ncbi:Aste57867_8538 [Aphanomyces stellatus]|uniref:Aste57867_8538 protein n=1 Tax=Aphanomyces stellatus TaxID=120398 RepID=A0A485KKQ9_9STRA|nr:hypothetical protein As57867_008506 [Aphanomyces stellatus]VFT85424.1 Aste57867_8538 [Aphanomyces stellatus]
MQASMRVLVLLLSVLAVAQAVIFQVRPYKTKCLTTDVDQDSQVITQYQVLGNVQGKTNVAFWLEDPKKVQLKSDPNVDSTEDQSHEFKFTAETHGTYTACFTNSNDRPVQISFEFKHGVEAIDYSDVAKKEHLMPVEKELRKLEDTVAEIHREMLYVRDREASMRDTNESTNTRVTYLNALTIVILLGVGVWQIFYLKSFFKSKKLI